MCIFLYLYSIHFLPLFITAIVDKSQLFIKVFYNPNRYSEHHASSRALESECQIRLVPAGILSKSTTTDELMVIS